jgi:lysophospholipase L1-like esterase
MRKIINAFFAASVVCMAFAQQIPSPPSQGAVTPQSPPASGTQPSSNAPVPAHARPTYPPPTSWQQRKMDTFANDFGQLAWYRDADNSLSPPARGEKRVIFFGDSITAIWKLDQSFPDKGYINRGIGGQTTSQMVLRYRQDVLNLHPKVVVILAGTNDIAGNTGAIAVKDIENNFETLAELAQLQKVHVIFSSLTPVNNYTGRAKPLFNDRPIPKILELNQWLKQYSAAHKGVSYLDYYDAMVDKNGMMPEEMAVDGLHPNQKGFAVMAPLAETAIERAIK